MVDVDAALGVALMLAAAPLLRATALAAGVVRPGGQLAALDHLIHVAAAALHGRLLGTGWALAQVALAAALMRMCRLAAPQHPRADSLTGGDGVQAAGALAGCHRHLSTGAAGYLVGAQLAGPAASGVARVFALVIAARQRLATALLARVAALVLALARACHLAVLLAAMAVLLHLLRAGDALPGMALRLAPVLAAVEQLVADLAAQQILLHGALHCLGAAPAAATAHHIGLTRRTRARVTEQGAGMTAALDPAAYFAATVRQFGARHRRVLQLAAEAEILARQLLQHILARRTPPAYLRLGAARPGGGALEVQNMVAVLTRPGRLVRFDGFHAHQALEPPLLNVTN